jgi:N-acetylglucosaminyldiphosphoundecaprenol N-acetyl-beta-D-mannosaminyltransferase
LFDFLAGKDPRAPQWMQASGLEWLYRLSREPRRLFRRYASSNLHPAPHGPIRKDLFPNGQRA